MVADLATNDASSTPYLQEIIAGSGGAISDIADANNPLFASAGAGFVIDPVGADVWINNSGQVAFHAVSDSMDWVGNGSSWTPVPASVYDVTNGSGVSPTINDSGVVAYIQNGPEASDAIDTWDVTTPTQSPTPVFSSYTEPYGHALDPTINANGAMVAYLESPPPGESAPAGYYEFDGPAGPGPTFVASGMAWYAAINECGKIAYDATESFNAAADASWPTSIDVDDPGMAPVTVVQAGDSLGGTTVQWLGFGREGMNDSGQVVFLADLTNNTEGLFLATPTTTTTLAVSAASSVYGQSVTLTADVSSNVPGVAAPGGTVTFMDGSTPLGTVPLDSSDTASLTTSALAVGTDPITAVYNGDANFAGSTSAVDDQLVGQAATLTTVVSSVSNPVFGEPVTFTATVAATPPGAGSPTGTVTFLDGSTVLGAGTLSTTGGITQAALTTTNLSLGSQVITASYAGDPNFAGSTGTINNIVVNPATATVRYVGQDTTTEGNWIGTYGRRAMTSSAARRAFQPTTRSRPAASRSIPGRPPPPTRALQVPGSSNRVAAVWYSATSFTVNMDLADGHIHDVELYFLDWDNKGRSEQVQISDASSGTVLDTETISSFSSGVYLDWQVSGNVVIKITRLAGANAVLNGVFIDASSASTTATASYLRQDATTQGSWIGNYGCRATTSSAARLACRPTTRSLPKASRPTFGRPPPPTRALCRFPVHPAEWPPSGIPRPVSPSMSISPTARRTTWNCTSSTGTARGGASRCSSAMPPRVKCWTRRRPRRSRAAFTWTGGSPGT